MAGKVVHFEVPAADSGRAKQFYGELFGWQFQDPWGEMDYHLTEGGAVVGSEHPGHLTVYFDTEDIDASVARVRELGGAAEDKSPIPGVGWFAGCQDSEGNAFSLFQGDDSVQHDEARAE
ncbi:MAG: VOC family protein [Gaiellaceae bacterium]